MLLTLVPHGDFEFGSTSKNVILEKESSHVPCNGDLIKDGHSLSSFSVYRVEERMFHSAPARGNDNEEFTQVYLLVSEVAAH